MQIPFGKYSGRELSDPEVPTTYLAWLYTQNAPLYKAIEEELARREAEEEGHGTWPERIIAAGFRALAQQHHPDHGGKAEDMRAILGAKAELAKLAQYLRNENAA